jgi:hypothetical protein
MTSVYKEKVGKVKISENQLVTKSIETLVEKTLPYNVCVEEMGKTESLKPSVEIEDKTKHSHYRPLGKAMHWDPYLHNHSQE